MIRAFIDPESMRMRLDGHAGYAPAGQDIVCASVSMLAAALAEYLLNNLDEDDVLLCELEPGHAALEAAPMRSGGMELCRHAFGMTLAGFGLLAERYPENVILD